jgi:tetratricopeptide (TPR) repeat protein
MKRFFFAVCILLATLQAAAQPPDTKQLQETARTFMRQGDYANATLVLNRGLQQDPQNIAIAKDLALSYYFQKDNPKALEIIKPTLDRDEADDQCFQIAGNIYKELDLPKECEKLYKKGIKKFPASGALYNEFGELLWAQKSFDAIKQWEKGIEADPSYSKNYYNASKYYYFTTDKVWSILYGEIFINMEPQNIKTAEIKDILLESYKKLFKDVNLEQPSKDQKPFVRSFLQSMNKQTAVAANGINIETLTMIRTRFILDWNNGGRNKFPHKLFEYHQQLLQEGMFVAYNQWIFGSSENLAAFQNWTQAHAQEYDEFTRFQKGRVFKIPNGQYYR